MRPTNALDYMTTKARIAREQRLREVRAELRAACIAGARKPMTVAEMETLAYQRIARELRHAR